MKSNDRKKMVKKLDVVFSKFIRKRDGHCMKCGRLDGGLQCAHIAGRRSQSGRWNEKNAITLCYFCHLRWSHQNPLEFTVWLKDNLPEFYEKGLRVTKTTVKNLDLEALFKYYQRKL